MTGMPALGPTHNEDETLHLVAFLRHLPKLTDAETKSLQPTVSITEHHQEGLNANAGGGK